MSTPEHVVVDTNVATTANGINEGAPATCVAASARALQHVMARGRIYIDHGRQIVKEYQTNLSAKGQPGPGDAFLKWLLTHEWGGERVTRVPLTPKSHDPEDYEELPAAADGTLYDPSDRKFLAVAAAHPDHPPILQAFDSKWWGWQSALNEIGVTIHFHPGPSAVPATMVVAGAEGGGARRRTVAAPDPLWRMVLCGPQRRLRPAPGLVSRVRPLRLRGGGILGYCTS